MIKNDIQNGGAAHRSSNQIEADIRQTRSRMDTTLDEIGERLNARYIINSALDWWEARTTTARTQGVASAKVAGRVLGQQIKANPMPSVLIGAGIAWLIFKDDDAHRESHRASGGYRPDSLGRGEMPDGDNGPGFTDKVKAKAAGATGAVGDAVGTVKEKVGSLAHSASETAADLRDAAKEGAATAGHSIQETAGEMASRARQALDRGKTASQQLGHDIHHRYETGVEQVRHGMEAYPLAAGLGFAALGALLGLVLPHTRREDELLGERSEHLIGTVKDHGKELLERGKAVVERVAETAFSEAQKQGLTPESAGDAFSGLAAKAGEVFDHVKQEAVSAAEEQGLTPGNLKEQALKATKPSKEPGHGISNEPAGTLGG